MKKLFFALLLLILTYNLYAQTVTNCQSNTQDNSNQVSVNNFVLDDPNDTIFIWTSAMLTYEGNAFVYDDSGIYSQVADAPANIIGHGQLFMRSGISYNNSPIIANWEVNNLTMSMIVCELPNDGMLWRDPVYNNEDSVFGMDSGMIHGFIGSHINSHLFAFCVEAGASVMQPFIAGDDYYIPENATTERSGCEFGTILGTGMYKAKISWTGFALHASSVYLAFN